MKLYHTFESKSGFDINKMDFERGVFCIPDWWTNHKDPKWRKYSAFHPNEFGDKVVELDMDDNAKTYTTGNQLDVLEKFLSNSSNTKKIIDKYEKGNFYEREDWHKLDRIVGTLLKKKGYKLIHYTADEMYGDTWAIIDKSIIKGIRFENENEKI